MTKKLILSLLVITLLASLFVGCGDKKDSATEDTKSSELSKDDPTTFKMFYGFKTGNDHTKKDSKTVKYIQEQTGVTLDIEYLVGDLKTKVGVMVSSGEYPDYIWGHEAHEKFIEAKACVPMNDYIEKYGENIKKIYGDNIKKLKRDDGNIYFVSPYVEDVALEKASQGFWVQKAVLKDAGWPKITTLDEYFDLLSNYKEKNPKIDGKDTIGFEILTDSWRIFCLTNPPSYLMGYPNDGAVIVDPKTYEAKDFSRMDESKKYYKKLNEMFNKGMVDKESFVMNYEKYIEKLSSGRVLGFYDQEWQMKPAQDALEKQKMWEQTYVALPIVYDESIKEQYQNPGLFGTRDGVSISTQCKEPVKAFKFMDWILNEDVQKITNWGFKDEEYYINDEGVIARTDEQRAKFEDQQYKLDNGLEYLGYPWPRGINTSKYSDGSYWRPNGDPSEINATYNESEKEVLKAYKVDTFSQMFNPPVLNPWGVAWDITIPDDSDEKLINTKREDTQRTYLPKLIMAKSDAEFEKLWDEFVKEVDKLGVDKVEAFLTEKIKERVEKWK